MLLYSCTFNCGRFVLAVMRWRKLAGHVKGGKVIDLIKQIKKKLKTKNGSTKKTMTCITKNYAWPGGGGSHL